MSTAVVLNASWNTCNFRMDLVRTPLTCGYEVRTIAPVDVYTQFPAETGCICRLVGMHSQGVNPTVALYSIYSKIVRDVILHCAVKPDVYGTPAAPLLEIPVINNVCKRGTVFLKKDLVAAIAVLLNKICVRFAARVFFQNPDDLKLRLDKKLVAEQVCDSAPGSGTDSINFQRMGYRLNAWSVFLHISRLIADNGIVEYIEAVKSFNAKVWRYISGCRELRILSINAASLERHRGMDQRGSHRIPGGPRCCNG